MDIQEHDPNQCQISGVQSINIPLVWDQVAPLLERALAYAEGLYTVQDIYGLLMYHKMQLWIIADEFTIHGCAVTEFRDFPQKKVCYAVLAAGELEGEWGSWFDTVELWAYGEGASVMKAYGRPGWKPYVKKQGYHVSCYLYSKDLCSPEGIAH